MPFWRGLVLGFILAVGLVGLGLFYTLSRGVTVAVDKSMVAQAIGAQVEAQAGVFLPEMLTGFKQQLTVQVSQEVEKSLGKNMEIAFGSLQIPLPPQVSQQMDQYVVKAVEQTLVLYLQGLDTKQLATKMGRIAAVQAKEILGQKLVGQTFLFHPYPWLTVPVHVVMNGGTGGNGWGILSAAKRWP